MVVRSYCASAQYRKTKTKTYNSEDSLVVTHPTTNSPACGLSTAERTGSPVFHTLWSYVIGILLNSLIFNKELNEPDCQAVQCGTCGCCSLVG
ncbi:hypothetical protein N7461_001954 [Penicillium sp. DV-2018c]|nr:hypothetical protein N7461_001954 [Penicillium sp. DV-2018c]